MNDLNINVCINLNCKLTAEDRTEYNLEDLKNHVSIEFLTDHNDDVVDDSVLFLSDPYSDYLSNNNVSEFDLPSDGTYTYYKILAPKLEHLIKNKDAKYDTIYAKDELFYYNGSYYYGENVDKKVYVSYNLDQAIDHVLSKSIKIVDYREL